MDLYEHQREQEVLRNQFLHKLGDASPQEQAMALNIFNDYFTDYGGPAAVIEDRRTSFLNCIDALGPQKIEAPRGSPEQLHCDLMLRAHQAAFQVMEKSMA